jgi:hypothetical protein
MGGVRGRGRGKWGGWVAWQQPVLPGGRNSSHKAQKGQEKKKLEKLVGRICGRKLAELFPELAELFPELAEVF